MKIHVRRRHIEMGKHGPRSCPIALAFAEIAGVIPWVGQTHIYPGRGLINSKVLPVSARHFIARFDAGKPVKPFAFVLK